MSNLNLNKVILGGRLTADIELKQTANEKSVCSFSIAVNRKFQREGEQTADFINCVAWNKTAEFISKYFKKGSSICIVGNIQTRSWTDSNGQKRYATEVIADEALFVDSRNEAGQAETEGAGSYIPDAYNVPKTPDFEPVALDSDLPF